jgi:tripartite-type tricarboxylate transporter receptor subunit TctC
MQLPRRKLLRLAAAAGALPTLSRLALAQSWPTRPIRVVVGYPAGITPDIVARLVGQRVAAKIGQQIIVENRPGAGTSIAAEEVVRSPADGYSLLMVAAANTINTTLYPALHYNFSRDITPVASIGGVIFVMVVNPKVPAKTVPELIAYAKANPGKLSMASRGNGSLTHVFGELFKMMAGIDMVHVPYRADYTPDLIAGRVQVAFNAVADATGHVKNGQLRALAVTSAKRLVALPDVSTVGESLPGYVTSGWLGFGAPKGTPSEIVDRLYHATSDAVAEPDVAKRLAAMGMDPMRMTPAEFGKFMNAETEKWAKVIKFANIQLK